MGLGEVHKPDQSTVKQRKFVRILLLFFWPMQVLPAASCSWSPQPGGTSGSSESSQHLCFAKHPVFRLKRKDAVFLSFQSVTDQLSL